MAHRAREGSQPYPTQNNPRVSSKNDKRYGRDGSKLSGATFKSTGDQPAGQQHDDLPPSLPQHSYTDRLPPGGISRRVGFLGGGKPAVPVSHAATLRRHGSDGIHDPRTSTDNAPGQAHSVSGGRFGKPQVRAGARAPSGTKRQDSGALDRRNYSPTRK